MASLTKHALEILIPLSLATLVSGALVGGLIYVSDSQASPEYLSGVTCSFDEQSGRFTIRDADGEIIHESSKLQQTFLRQAYHTGYGWIWAFPTEETPYELYRSDETCWADSGWDEIDTRAPINAPDPTAGS